MLIGSYWNPIRVQRFRTYDSATAQIGEVDVASYMYSETCV